jgi:DNA-binding response OmpR family regulator
MRAPAVEDDAPIAADPAPALAGAGFRVETCGNGGEAWVPCDTGDHDLVVPDLDLPVMDALSARKRRRAGGRGIAVLVLTARGVRTGRAEGIEAGADDYLPKSFRMEELVARARARALGRRAAGQR